ncbi:MAG: hypothetical protein ACXWR1_10260 [Bdellovibrionota bacterium]
MEIGEPKNSSLNLVLELAFLLSLVGIGLVALPFVLDSRFRPRFQGSVRTSEAKIGLAAIYGSERSYFSEHAAFSESLASIDYNPEQRRRFYAIGFPTRCLEKENVPEESGILSTANSPFAQGREQEILHAFRSLPDSNCQKLSSGFEAYAVGIVQKDAPLDIWRIDQDKHLEHFSAPPPSLFFEALSGFYPVALFLVCLLPLLGPYHLSRSVEKREEAPAAVVPLARVVTHLYYTLLIFIFVLGLTAPNFTRYSAE